MNYTCPRPSTSKARLAVFMMNPSMSTKPMRPKSASPATQMLKELLHRADVPHQRALRNANVRSTILTQYSFNKEAIPAPWA